MIKLLFLLGFLTYMYDINIDNYYEFCINNTNINFLLLIHHFISAYIHFGWIYNDKYYIIILLLAMIHWFTNNNKCFYTEYVNKKCNINPNKPFRDIIYFSGLKNSKYYRLIYYTYLISIIFYIVYYKKN